MLGHDGSTGTTWWGGALACETGADLKEAELRLTKWFGAPSARS
ncbi:hypothetical protein GGE67_004848 [Rhizobium leucaenae]|uniref:Uncharacterized protein n=1 Tax=Rhizobium leucaenae TaxID=29450 RepID=A0A7W7EMH8_9HYPH|nr:hypothetical protein [Rhizobium leucaenae]MBB4571111.1 hypothetical protein [Rhizobium leucaenae]MBB6304205.1 hypothetical protein [Rhizobium leucaenae]